MKKVKYKLKRPIQNEKLAVYFFVLTFLSMSLIFYYDLKTVSRNGEGVMITEGQQEMFKRAKIIQKVLMEGKLELTPGRYYRVLEEPQR